MIIGFTLLWEAIRKLKNAKMQDGKKNLFSLGKPSKMQLLTETDFYFLSFADMIVLLKQQMFVKTIVAVP